MTRIDQGRPSVAIGQRRTEKISEVIARDIVRDLRGHAPGTKLPPESEMLATYRVGRGSLREALRLLEVHGLIVIKPGPGGGPIIAQVDSVHYGRMSTLYYHMLGATYQDVVDARLVMEPLIVRMIAEGQDPDHISRLNDWLNEVGSTGPEKYVETAAGFHDMIMTMSGNPILDLTAHALQTIYVERARGMVFDASEHHEIEKDHVAIVNAIVKGNASRAEQLMRQHMLDYVEVSRRRSPIALSATVDWH